MSMFFGPGFGYKKVPFSITGAPCGAYLRQGGCGDGPIIRTPQGRKAFPTPDAAHDYVRDVINPRLNRKSKKAHVTFLV